jgi:hypothetical protein
MHWRRKFFYWNHQQVFVYKTYSLMIRRIRHQSWICGWIRLFIKMPNLPVRYPDSVQIFVKCFGTVGQAICSHSEGQDPEYCYPSILLNHCNSVSLEQSFVSGAGRYEHAASDSYELFRTLHLRTPPRSRLMNIQTQISFDKISAYALFSWKALIEVECEVATR